MGCLAQGREVLGCQDTELSSWRPGREPQQVTDVEPAAGAAERPWTSVSCLRAGQLACRQGKGWQVSIQGEGARRGRGLALTLLRPKVEQRGGTGQTPAVLLGPGCVNAQVSLFLSGSKTKVCRPLLSMATVTLTHLFFQSSPLPVPALTFLTLSCALSGKGRRRGRKININ